MSVQLSSSLKIFSIHTQSQRPLLSCYDQHTENHKMFVQFDRMSYLPVNLRYDNTKNKPLEHTIHFLYGNFFIHKQKFANSYPFYPLFTIELNSFLKSLHLIKNKKKLRFLKYYTEVFKENPCKMLSLCTIVCISL